MTSSQWVWMVLVLVYLAFFSWYTSFEGPLTEAEMARYLELAANDPTNTPDDVVTIRKFMEEDDGDDLVMVNIVHMYDKPLQIEGVLPTDTSDEVLARYMEYMFPAMLSRASHPVFFGKSVAPQAMDLMNAEGMEVWSNAAGVRYRSRRDLLEIGTNPAFAGRLR